MAGSLYNTVFGGGADVTNGKMGNVSFADGAVISAGTANGLIFGGNANQKLGEFGVTAVIQPSGTGELLGLNGNAATASNATNMNSNGNTGNTAYTFNDVVKALKAAGSLRA